MKRRKSVKRKSKEIVAYKGEVAKLNREVLLREAEQEVYKGLKRKATAGDFLMFKCKDAKGNIIEKPYGTKQWWAKVRAGFGAVQEVKKAERITNGENYTWKYLVRVTLPNGRYAEAEGACSSNDKFFIANAGYKIVNLQESDIIHTAQTAGFNRATSDLFGGDVSAEEMGMILGDGINSVKNLNLRSKAETEAELDGAKKKLSAIWLSLGKLDPKRYDKKAWGELWKNRRYVYDEIVKLTDELGEELQTLKDSAELVQKDGVK